ncbi:MAG: hypothetical protein PHI90_10800 [Clostridia bacterium]|nr:hypothetical protein [Clostridia bacterium]MDD4049277.1 hypothetical protein [Clostridia bacterium]
MLDKHTNYTYDSFLFVKKLQEILSQPPCFENNTSYLDLGQVSSIDDTKLETTFGHIPPSDPLTKALGYILQSMRRKPFTLTKLGINELLKSYLYHINTDNQKVFTTCYLGCIEQIFLSCLSKNYPFTNLLWEYLSRCFNTVSEYLVAHKLEQGCQVFLDKVSCISKTAAQEGLHTSLIQYFLHNLEIWAREEGYIELADNAKNYRFNIETF